MRIEAKGLAKRFGRTQALDEVSFQITSGQRVALIGPNGSGKSTLNRILMGLLHFDGSVRLDDFSPLADRIQVAHRLAYVPQTAPQLAAPVGELVGFLERVRGLSRGELEQIADELELDLPAIARAPFRSLSGGMKQKFMIASALATRASLLILDEPTGSLDARSRERFFALLRERAADATWIVCSHRLEEVRHLTDHVLMLHEGRVRYDGPADAFLEASTRTMLEVRIEGDSAAVWLTRHDFHNGSGPWWVRSVSHAEKRKLLPELVTSLGEALMDLNVRDLESLELEDDPRGER